MSLALERFELRAFGPFTATTLELGGSPGSLHIICGPNEAGKSTARRAIGDFLFGIPARSSDNQIHEHGQLRLAATLVDADGRRLELVRRKGNRSTLLDVDGSPVDEGVLQSLLGGIGRETFEAMFSITYEALVEGGEGLLDSRGEVGESLFSASIGATSLHRVREQLALEADGLFRPRASSTRVMQVKSALEAAEKRLAASTLRVSAFTENERNLAEGEAERGGLAGQLAELRAREHGRQRVRLLLPLVLERDRLRAQLAQLGDVPALSLDAGPRRLAATAAVAAARRGAAEAEARIADVAERADALSEDAGLLDREGAIRDLAVRSAGMGEVSAELEDHRAQLAVARSLATRCLAGIRADLELEAAEALLLDARQRRRVEAALDTRQELAVQRREAERQSAEEAQRASELTARLAPLTSPPDTAALEREVAAALSEGPLEERLAGAEAELAGLADHLAVALAGLNPRVSAQALAGLLCPSPETIERFAAARQALLERTTQLAERRSGLAEKRDVLAEDRARLSLDGEVPSAEELAFARARRDRDWARVRARLEGDANLEASPENVERGIALADELADVLREHAGVAAQAADLDLRDERLSAEFAVLAGQDEALRADRAAHERDWLAAWETAGIAPLTPEEMTAWLRERRTALDRSLEVSRAQRSVAGLAARREEHLVALRSALDELGIAAAVSSSLSRLLARAQEAIAAAATQREARAELSLALDQAEAARRRHAGTLATLAARIERWQGEWRELLAVCGWPADVVAADARDLLETLGDLAAHLREAERLATRAASLELRLDDVARDAGALIGELAPDLASVPLIDAVTQLDRRLHSALEDRSRRAELDTEREAAGQALARHRRELADAEADLDALIRAAGVPDAEALEAVEARATEAGRLAEGLSELERRITEAGQAPLAEILAQTAGVDVDALHAASAAAAEEISALEGRLEVLDRQHGELTSQRREMERAGGAAEASQEVEELTAELRDLVARYMRVSVTAWALGEAIDRYRRDHKDPLLRRAAELFPALTEGSFAGLEVDFGDADSPVLIGARPGGERVGVEQMSTGTREQLYLALRLASLERHMHLHGPMPVILDDVVLHSDPRRKTAILRALAQLSRQTQVIAFSHDPQTVALAQAAIDPAQLTIHELGSRDLPQALHPAVGAGDVRPLRQREAA